MVSIVVLFRAVKQEIRNGMEILRIDAKKGLKEWLT